jgi:hypothetical protein
MGSLTNSGDGQALQKNMMASFVQIAALVILVSYCVVIISSFVGLAIWGVVMAAAAGNLDAFWGRPKDPDN